MVIKATNEPIKTSKECGPFENIVISQIKKCRLKCASELCSYINIYVYMRRHSGNLSY